MIWPPYIYVVGQGSEPKSKTWLKKFRSSRCRTIQKLRKQVGPWQTICIRSKSVFQSDFFKCMRCFLFLRYVVRCCELLELYPQKSVPSYITHDVPERGHSGTTPGTGASVLPDHLETQPVEIMNQQVPQPPPPTNFSTLPTAALREQYQGSAVPTEACQQSNWDSGRSGWGVKGKAWRDGGEVCWHMKLYFVFGYHISFDLYSLLTCTKLSFLTKIFKRIMVHVYMFIQACMHVWICVCV